MTTGPGTGRVSTSETTRALLAILSTQAQRTPPPAYKMETSTTTLRPAGEPAYRVHNWSVQASGDDADEVKRTMTRIDDELAAKFASELDTDTLAGDLARSVVK